MTRRISLQAHWQQIRKLNTSSNTANNIVKESAVVIDDRIKNLSTEELHYLPTLPFWTEEHRPDSKCCFNCYVGWPIKISKEFSLGKECPMFPYELDILFPTFEQEKLIAVLKSRNLGVSEFSLRYLSWKALTDPKYKDTQIAIVVGGGQKGATDLIGRVRGFF